MTYFGLISIKRLSDAPANRASDIYNYNEPVSSAPSSLSSLFEDLSEVIRVSPLEHSKVCSKPAEAGVATENVYGNFNQPANTSFRMDIPAAKSLFSSPKKFSHIQRSVHSLHSAKSVIYGSTFFGPRKFYGEEFDFSKEPIHPTDRRRIRFGLRSVVDFVIQLDLQNLNVCMSEPDMIGETFLDRGQSSLNPRFAADSFWDLLMRANPSKGKLVHEIFERLISNLLFSQTSDGSIETSKLVISQALKLGPDLGRFLRGGPFASCAQVYRNLSSRFDFDAAFFLLKKTLVLKLSRGAGNKI